jgi:hypothetical protein
MWYCVEVPTVKVVEVKKPCWCTVKQVNTYENSPYRKQNKQNWRNKWFTPKKDKVDEIVFVDRYTILY